MGRPKIYLTAEEKRAAQLATYKRYNAKRYAKIDTTDFMEVPGVKITQTKNRTYYRSTETGKFISGNKISKIIPSSTKVKQIKKEEINKLITKRAKQLIKKIAYDVKYNKKTQLQAETDLARTRGQSIKQAITIYRNRLAGAKLAIRTLTESSMLFTDEQKELMYKHSENFSKIAAEGERAGFWEIYNEILTSGGSYGKEIVRTDSNVLKLREMFETQLGEQYTKTFLKFLY